MPIPSGAADRPAWHTDDYPELRSAPPWVTGEMVASQPGLVAPILAHPQTTELAQVILDVDESGEPIAVTGCGTSEHGAMAVAELLDAALRQRGARGGWVEARQALEAALDPRSRGAGRGSPGLVGSTALRRQETGSTRTAPLESIPSVTIRPTPPAGSGSLSSRTSATRRPSISPMTRFPRTVSDRR